MHRETNIPSGVRRRRRIVRGLVLLVAALLAPACANKEVDRPRAQRAVVAPRDVPSALRGIIGSQATIVGLQPTRLSGIGFVVGLNNTGGGTLNDRVSFHMERELSLRGVGQGAFDGTPFEGMSPRQLLQDKRTAVVLVYALVPPGAPNGTEFDVFVTALNATSLEGGRLYTTDLRIGDAQTFEGTQRRKIAEARGNIYINPFAEPGEIDSVVSRNTGRILAGGMVTATDKIRVLLDNPSHSRARQMVSAINSRFPQRPGDRNPFAIGRDERTIEVDVPREYLDRSEEFVQILAHIQVNQSAPQIYARQYVDALRREPYLADDLGWALHALGEPALPFLRELYDDSELIPRLVALRTGARLGDDRAAGPLKELAVSGPESVRTDAIELLGRINGGPTVDETLKSLLDAPSLPVRVSAYEALVKRAERARFRTLVEYEQLRDAPVGLRASADQLRQLSELNLPAGTIQAVSRVPMYGKFLLDRVPVGDPLIYVTQQGAPRIVLFGEDLSLVKPSLVSAWSDRLMLVSESETDAPRLFYRAIPGKAVRFDSVTYRTTYQGRVDDSVTDLIDFLAREWTPDQQMVGLGLTYSEVVGALHELYKGGALTTGFATERDRLIADLLASADGDEIEVRPETPGDRRELVVFNERDLTPQAKPEEARDGGLLVPIERTPTKGK
jgi:flagellar basal body P-ring protein FlgI